MAMTKLFSRRNGEPPVCPDHAVHCERVSVEGATPGGQAWWICRAQTTVTLIQRACCGNTTATA